MELSQDEKNLLRKYAGAIECAAKRNYYTAVRSTDMLQLQNIYKRHVDTSWSVNVWCGNCCITALRGIYSLSQEVIRENTATQ